VITNLSRILTAIHDQDPRAWLYLPHAHPWSLGSAAAAWVSDEVPPEAEDEPDAGVPEAAKRAGLMRVLPIAVVQEIVANARAQVPHADEALLLKALLHYYDTDAFAVFS
jgi:hypothetical protein